MILDQARAVAANHSQSIGLERLVVGSGALLRLASTVTAVKRAGEVIVLQDATPIRVGPKDLKAEIEALLGPPTRVVTLGSPGSLVHVDANTIEAAAAATRGAGCVVSVGSGTITDIAKEASRIAGVPLVALQTAASVNGFADGMAVVLKDGVKRTVQSVWPVALVVDPEILASAPGSLNRSGYAEMMAMFTAPADWRLAQLMGQDDSYDADAVALFREQGDELLAAAGAVGEGSEAGLELLSDLLTASGLAMGAVGRTAPMSGTEHLISHLIDMSAATDGRPVGMHGAQVGVAAVVAACVWEHVLDRIDAAAIRRAPEFDGEEETVAGAFRELDVTGAMGEECWSDYRLKLRRWQQDSDEAGRNWERSRTEFDGLVGDAATLAGALTNAGAPARFSQLDPAITPQRVRWALASAPLMRDRFTVLDLARFTGYWQDSDIEAVLERAAGVGGGL